MENDYFMRRLMITASAAVAGALLLAACSSSSSSTPAGSNANASSPVTVRLGYLANITHASALVGVKEGFFTKALGSAGTVKTSVFTSGTQETTAVLAGQLDAAYVGPGPAISAFQKTSGQVKVVSGSAEGGASVVTKSSITSVSQLKGQSVATPSLGNTQDIALRAWLKTNGLSTTTIGGGDVSVKPTAPNSAAVLEFKSGQIAGGDEPAPYDVEMVNDGGHVLLKQSGVTTLLVVTESFLTQHPAIVEDLLKAQVEANDFIKNNTAQAEADANAELATYTGKPLKSSVLKASFNEITFTNNPDASSLTAQATDAVSVGLLKSADVSGIFDLTPLNKELSSAGEAQISS
jgi:NitT/TauT family transport system substrate-binding protein